MEEKYIERARKIEAVARSTGSTNKDEHYVSPEDLEALIGADAKILTLNMTPALIGGCFLHAIQYKGITYLCSTNKPFAPVIYKHLKEGYRKE